MCVCVNIFKLKYISATSAPILTIFYLNHHRGGRKAALGFGPDRIRTLMSMATDSSHRVIMGKCCQHSSAFIFDRIFFILAGNENLYNISDEFEIRPDRLQWKKRCHHIFSNVFNRIHFIRAGNDDIHKSLIEFEIRRDKTMDYGVGCP